MSEPETLDSIFERMADTIEATYSSIKTYVPHPKQHEFHSSTDLERLFLGGNRSGKSLAGVAEDIFWVSETHPYRATPVGPIRGRVCSVDFVNGIAGILFPIFQKLIPPQLYRHGSWNQSYDKRERVLEIGKRGSFIEFKSYDQDLDKHAGTSRHFIHFDEEPPEDIYNENLARLVDTNGSYWITMTPVEGMTWVFDKLVEPYAEENGVQI